MKNFLLLSTMLVSLSSFAAVSEISQPTDLMNNRDGAFDEVVVNNDLVETYVPAGFAMTKVLWLIENETVKPLYQKLIQGGGRLYVDVRKVESTDPAQSRRTRYRFITKTRALGGEQTLKAALVVDTYHLLSVADALPTESEIVETSGLTE